MLSKEALSKFGINELNEMQLSVSNAILGNPDVVLHSPTGTGKTIGFLLPLLQLLNKSTQNIQCIIIVPSRELALQVTQVWQKLGTGYKVNAFYGGNPIETEINSLREPPALVVGTPGRIADHLSRGTFDTSGVQILVLDEFDKCLSLGFEEVMATIIGQLPNVQKRILVSATSAIEIPAFTGISAPVVIDHTEDMRVDGLTLNKVISKEKDKVNTLFQLLCYIGSGSAIIFCNHREAVERTSGMIADMGIANIAFHGGMEQMEREQALAIFANGSVRYLVATDLAARGLDISGLDNIVHYHLPGTAEEFIHRNGRTARMNTTGTAWLLLHQEEQLPPWLPEELNEIELPTDSALPPPTGWATVYVSGGKKDKISKTDIVGFFVKTGGLSKDHIGKIDVKDHLSFVAVKKGYIKELLQKVKDEKMKGKKYRIAIAR